MADVYADTRSRSVRYLVACAVFIAGLTAMAAEPDRPAAVTVLLQFEGQPSARAVDALRTEVAKVMQPSGLQLEYRVASELGPEETPTDIILVKFKGACRRDVLTPLPDERGPYAITHSSDGEILPFAEVACDRVQSSIRRGTGNVTDEILGRALARVVAHEMYHILAKTPHHAHEGLARKGLSARDLITENLMFSSDEVGRMTQEAVAGSRIRNDRRFSHAR